MAILTGFPDLEVEVMFNDTPFPEYPADANISETEVSNYIQVRFEDMFWIRIRIHTDSTASTNMHAVVALDGVPVCTEHLEINSLKSELGCTISKFWYKVKGRMQSSELRFCPVVPEQNNAHTLRRHTEAIKFRKTGTIAVRFYYINQLKSRRVAGKGSHRFPGASLVPLTHKRSLRRLGLANHDSSDPPTQTLIDRLSWCSDYVPEDHKALAVFHFIYRPSSQFFLRLLNVTKEINTLISLHIVPHSLKAKQLAQLLPQPQPQAPAITVDEPIHKQHSEIRNSSDSNNLSTAELKAIISSYRSSSSGLESLSKRELLALLAHYRNTDTAARGTIRDVDDDAESRAGRKRVKFELIDLEE
ncbi:hypothetical protein GQ44DRAFT_823384 [Phaeosphaeriaceae sp. PMI808]|nr:hypothetical protein GQ44DRAFT_823384 [Phaeosphaeriaceae sp. PMI808]